MPTEKELKSHGRGSMVEKVAVIDVVQLGLVSWFDNKVVYILSSYVGSNPVTTKKRFSKKDKKYKKINSPKAVDVYNNYENARIWVALTYWTLYLYFIEFNCAQENGIRKYFFTC